MSFNCIEAGQDHDNGDQTHELNNVNKKKKKRVEKDRCSNVHVKLANVVVDRVCHLNSILHVCRVSIMSTLPLGQCSDDGDDGNEVEDISIH